jgi:hypothetical protein
MTEGEGGNTNSGTDWTADEIVVLVGSYFLMLAEERAGRPYNKSAYRRDVIEVIGRAHGAIERKLQNVSAVLDEIGVRWIQGYKPLDHYQDLLIEAVDGHLLKNPEFLDFRAAAPMRASDDAAVLVAAPALADSPSQARPVAIRRLVGKFDPAARDARNRALGRAGEEFVVGFERRRLERAGQGVLAEKVRWVSDADGDGAGYDVASFEVDGQRRLLEVKTTCGNERTPFWMTRRECEVAAEQGAHYRVRRLFHFQNEPKMFDISPPLAERLLLVPATFLATPRPE